MLTGRRAMPDAAEIAAMPEKGWREAAGEFGPADTDESVADIRDRASLAKVRDYKKQLKAAAKAQP